MQANFVKPLPVYIVYFSVAALNDGTIVNYEISTSATPR